MAWVYGVGVFSWIVSVITTFVMLTAPENAGDSKILSRWLLTSIFFGWMILPILFVAVVVLLWQEAELPSPKELIFKGPAELSEGQISIVEDEEKVRIRRN